MKDSELSTVHLADSLDGNVVVVDTSSLLMSGTAMLSVIKNCQLVIPAIVVKELEDKRSHATIGFLAREWLHLIEELRVKYGEKLSRGIPLDINNITLRIEPNHSTQQTLPMHLQDGSHDSTILSVANNLNNESIDKRVVILSNDEPMRIHATLDLHLEAHEFNVTQIIGAKPFDGRYTIFISEKEYVDSNVAGYSGKEELTKFYSLIKDKLPEDISYTSYITVNLDNGKTIDNFILHGKNLSRLQRKNKASKITARSEEQDVAMNYLKMPSDVMPVVSISGKAGSGKTLLSLAVALDELKAGRYDKITVFRSLHELGMGQEMGFLPGSVDEKMEAWAGAVYDALDTIVLAIKPRKKNDNSHVENTLQKSEKDRLREMVEVAPITYLRGRSLSNTFIILDEAQNFSRSELLNIISRVGEGSKIVLAFDSAQVDNKFLQSGKNADVWSVVDSLKSEDIFSHITLMTTERSRVAEIASRILES